MCVQTVTVLVRDLSSGYPLIKAINFLCTICTCFFGQPGYKPIKYIQMISHKNRSAFCTKAMHLLDLQILGNLFT